jgi:hypothetical protein
MDEEWFHCLSCIFVEIVWLLRIRLRHLSRVFDLEGWLNLEEAL